MSKLPGKAFTVDKYMPVARISAADGAILPFTSMLLQPQFSCAVGTRTRH
jgi:hypothetical protein